MSRPCSVQILSLEILDHVCQCVFLKCSFSAMSIRGKIRHFLKRKETESSEESSRDENVEAKVSLFAFAV